MILLFHLLTVIAGLLQPGGGRTLVALQCPRDFAPPGRFRGRHPNPIPSQTVALRATLEHVAEGRNFRISECRFLGAGRRNSENTSGLVGTITEPIPERIDFVTDISGWVSVGSGPGRVRAWFGWTNSLSTFGFYNDLTQNNRHFRKFMMLEFRDRLGRHPDRQSAKIIPLQIFNLQGQLSSVRLSVNQWVPGSSPGRGATFLLYFNHLRSEHRRLLVFWSMEIGIDEWAHHPVAGVSSPPGSPSFPLKFNQIPEI